jgi:predicted ArsR family transcriptional regulator
MSKTSRAASVVAIVELLKVLRSGSNTREEIADAMGWHYQTADAWVGELVANGIATESRRSDAGNAPKVFTLSAKWGGSH